MTLFGIIKDMLARGELTVARTFHPQMGEGERFLLDEKPVTIHTVVYQAGGMTFREPHDVLMDSTGKVVTFAKTVG